MRFFKEGNFFLGLLFSGALSGVISSGSPEVLPSSAVPKETPLPCHVPFNAVGSQPGCPVDKAAPPSRVVTVTGTVPNDKGELPTTLVTWVSSNVVANPTEVDGQHTETTVPGLMDFLGRSPPASDDLPPPAEEGSPDKGASDEGGGQDDQEEDGQGEGQQDDNDNDSNDDGDLIIPPILPPPGGKPGGGGGNQPDDKNKDKDDEDSESDEDDEAEEEDEDESCVQTVSCTQKCMVMPQSEQAQTTTCEEDPDKIECETISVDECAPTSTVTGTTTTIATAQGGMCGYDTCNEEACDLSPGPELTATVPAGDEPPKITDFPKKARLTRRRPAVKHQHPSLTDDFQDPDQNHGAGNAGGPGTEAASSRMYSIKDITFPFTTGGGPSWGCTTVIVFSNRGVWTAHFWERANIFNNFEASLEFLHKGNPDASYPSLAEARAEYFGPDPESNEDAYFVNAVIFTPNAEAERNYVDREGRIIGPVERPSREGRPPTDPWWYPQVDRLIGEITRIVPEVSLGRILTYPVIPNMEEIVREPNTAEQGLIVWEYVPRHVHQTKDGKCALSRAIRITTPLGQVSGPFAWPWPPGKEPKTTGRKRAEGIGACPGNIDELLEAQGTQSMDEDFFDPNDYLSGGSADEKGNDEEEKKKVGKEAEERNKKEEEDKKKKEKDEEIEEEEKLGNPPKCKNLDLGYISNPGIVVGTDCEGYNPDERVTYTINQKRAIPTAFAA
ncbi:hypothetical protein NM208_g4364 [Fusarium decemcellulare]|uniref:Uncharacterized protein n=1 Tax=Fusarium decemcellulare TaxID=57161 RepID=A0ACC1SKW2_9HYPO|nr:hypothetical protein NM208_g4364 [Fusarium decemcellulare]